MSTEAVKQIIGRAVVESDYRELLLTDLAKALEGYELSEAEVTALKGLSRDNFDATVAELEERISRARTAPVPNIPPLPGMNPG